MNTTTIIKSAAIAGLFIAGSALAAVQTVTDYAIYAPAPASVELGVLESTDEIRMFREKANMTLPVPVATDFSGPGVCGSSGGAIIPAGTAVDVYMLHHDPVGSNDTFLDGTVRFNGQILGVIYEDARLDGTDGLLGNQNTVYPNGQAYRGLENCGPGDYLEISSNERSLTLDLWTTTRLDQVRVLVERPATCDPN